ncbi:BTB/POZ domain-containing protein 9 [Mactra antiquata]
MGNRPSSKSYKKSDLLTVLQKMASKEGSYPNMQCKDIVSQWVKKVNRYSSQYDSNSWPARCVIGEPIVYPKYGDIAGAWASADKDAHQFIEIEYDEAVYITGIDIYETYHAGGVVAVKALDDNNKWRCLYNIDRPQVIKTSRIFKPDIPPQIFRSKTLRIEVDCTGCRSWVEIDAVQLHGKRYLSDPPPSMNDLVNDLKITVNNPQFSDCQFLIEDKYTFYAHKVIICARSDYFKAMFYDNTKESQSLKPISIKDVCRDSFMAVLHYLYTNKLPDTPKYDCVMLTDVWRVADRLSMGGLKRLAANIISLQIDETNVVDLYVSATDGLPVIEEVKTNCVIYMSSNLPKIVNTQSFTQLPQEVMLEIIQGTTAKLQLR